MTRLIINLFFLVMICMTLAVLPINVDAIDMFDLGSIFDNVEEPIETEPEVVDDTFKPLFTATFDIPKDRITNPMETTVVLETNIPEMYKDSYTFDDLKIVLFQNDESYLFIHQDKIIKDQKIEIIDGYLQVTYILSLEYNDLNLDRAGFFDIQMTFDDPSRSTIVSDLYKVAYLPDIDYIAPAQTDMPAGTFTYKAYFLNEMKTHLVPLYFNVDYPSQITVEVRNRLYNIPSDMSGLAPVQMIPNRASVAKIGTQHYGVFFKSSEIAALIEDSEMANLSVQALVKSLVRLPNIAKLSLFVDDVQVEGSFFDIDLTTVYEDEVIAQVYLTEPTSTTKRYLVPVPVIEDNIYDTVWSILAKLKSGFADDRQWTQIIPPEVEVNASIIEGTTITLDFNDAFLNAYKDQPEYRTMMMNSIMYSLTSSQYLTKVVITVEGEVLTDYAGYDFTEAQLPPAFINFIGEF